MSWETPSRILILPCPCTQGMRNILENGMKIERNLSHFCYPKDPRHVVIHIYGLRVNGLKTKYCYGAMTHVHAWTKYHPLTFSLIVNS